MSKKKKPAKKKPPIKKAAYRSKFEAKIADQLHNYNVMFAYEGDKIPYSVPESKHWYIPDFKAAGLYIECKGLLDADARKKMILVKAQNPKLDIRIVFMRDQPIRKGSPTLYSDWAKRNNFTYAIGGVPKEWIT